METRGTGVSRLETCLRHRKAVLLACVAVLSGSLFVASHLPLEWSPSLSLPTITISAHWSGASPRGMERYVVAPLERALQGIPGTRRIESRSREENAFLRLEVRDNRRLGLLLSEVSDRVIATRDALPEHVDLAVGREAPPAFEDAQELMTLQLVGSASPVALRSFAERGLASQLRSLDGVAGVAIEGGRERELLVSVDGDRLNAYHLSIDAVQQQVRQAFSTRSYGWIEDQGAQSLIWSQGEDDPEGVREIALSSGNSTVHLSDVAVAAIGPALPRSLSRVDGKPVVTLQLIREPGSNILEVAARVRSELGKVRAGLPSGMEVLIANDRSDEVRDEFRALFARGGLGLLAILAVLFVVLGDVRSTVMVLFSASIAFSLGLALMQPLGLTLNVLTLAAFALLLGFLMSHAAIVVDQILVERGRGESWAKGYAASAVRALRVVWLPLLGGTLSTMVVFLPLVYLSGELRVLFGPFAVLAALTLVCSLLLATLVLPTLGEYLSKGSLLRQRRLGAGFLGPFRLASLYPKTILGLLVLAIGFPTPILQGIGQGEDESARSGEKDPPAVCNSISTPESIRGLCHNLTVVFGGVSRPFLEKVELGEQGAFEERPAIKLWLKLPPGSGLGRADERIRPFEEIALREPLVKRTITRIAGESGLLEVLFHEGAFSSEAPLALREALITHALTLADLEISISGLLPVAFYSGLGNVAGYSVIAYGPNYEELESVAQAFARRMARDPRVAEVDTNVGRFGEASGREVIRFRWDSEAVARTGLGAGALSSILRSQLLTEQPSFRTHLAGYPHLPVRIIMAGSQGQDLERVMGYSLASSRSSAPLRLADHAELSMESEPPVVEREDQQYRRQIQVYYRGPYHMGLERIDREIQTMHLPPGYRLERWMRSPLGQGSKKEIFWLILGTLGLVFLVLAAVLESWRLAGLVMVCVPLAWIGVAVGFLWSEQSFGEGAFLGSVLIIGVAVNSGILLADRFRRLRQARPGTPSSRLALLAVRNRLRPMWTTTLCSVAGMLPMLLLPGTKSFWVGLAITVVGGLLSSTLLAPVAMVALLSLKRKEGAPDRGPGDFQPNRRAMSRAISRACS